MIVSFLIPTHRRLQLLIDGIQSIREKASPDVQVEIIVRVDEDDYETLAGRDRIQGKVIVGPRWLGSESQHIFFNEMAAKSHGDWLVAWNDDLFMVTHHWDKLLPPADRARMTWLHSPTSVEFAFVAMTRQMYELWGCFVPPYEPIDYVIHKICQAAGKLTADQYDHSTQIIVDHRRNEDNIRAFLIRPEDRVQPPHNPNDKTFGELVKLLRDVP